MLSLAIMFIAFVITGFVISYIMVDRNKKARQIPEVSNSKALPEAAKTSIQEVLAEALENPPVGCMWEVTRKKRTVRANNYISQIRDVYSANIKLINPLNADLQFTLIVHDEYSSSNSIKSFQDDLAYNLEVLMGMYERMLRADEVKRDLESGWDGVYN